MIARNQGFFLEILKEKFLHHMSLLFCGRADIYSRQHTDNALGICILRFQSYVMALDPDKQPETRLHTWILHLKKYHERSLTPRESPQATSHLASLDLQG